MVVMETCATLDKNDMHIMCPYEENLSGNGVFTSEILVHHCDSMCEQFTTTHGTVHAIRKDECIENCTWILDEVIGGSGDARNARPRAKISSFRAVFRKFGQIAGWHPLENPGSTTGSVPALLIG